jgi:hypothetical protein
MTAKTPLALLAAILGMLVLTPAAALAAGPDYGFTGAFGSESTTPSNPEPLSGPAGVATSQVGATAGDVYVVDRANNRVEYFTSTGTLIGQFNGSAAPTGAFSSPEAIAVDNTPGSPSEGDVYVTDTGNDVIDKLSPTGTYLGQITTGSGGNPFTGLAGVAVDTAGVLWVYEGVVGAGEEDGQLDSYSNALVNMFLAAKPSTANGGVQPGLAVDSEDHLYVSHTGSRFVAKLNSAGVNEINRFGGEVEYPGIAVEPGSNDVYLGTGTTIAAFSPTETLLDRFGQGHLAAGAGIAVNAATGLLYVADPGANDVAIFTLGAGEPPTVGAQSSSGVSATGVTLQAVVNPEFQETTFAFEYSSEEAAIGTPAATTVAGASTLPAEDAQLPVSVHVSGLTPGATYFYRAAATNHTATVDGVTVEQFTTRAEVPLPGAGHAEEVTASTATLTATVNPRGGQTSYHFAYMTRTAYEAAVAQGATNPFAFAKSTQEGPPLPAGDTPLPVTLQARELTPGTVYEFALVANNSAGTQTAPPATFTTTPGPPTEPAREPEAVNPPPAPSPFPPVTLAPVIPFQTIAQLETKEPKANTGPPPLTNKQKLAKALKACRRDKKKTKRKSCERQAHKKYGK